MKHLSVPYLGLEDTTAIADISRKLDHVRQEIIEPAREHSRKPVQMREMIDGLLTRVGDPLDIIAASLEGGRNMDDGHRL